MKRLLHSYVALVRVSWAEALEYRAQVVLWFFSAVFPLVMLAVWLAIVQEAGTVAGWGGEDFASYYVGAALVNQITFTWTLWRWDEDIRLGDLSAKLLKPLDPFHHYASEMIGWKIFVIIVLGPLLIAAALVSPFINYPISLAQLAAFALAILGGFLLNLVMSTAFGMISFWSTQSANLYSLWVGAGAFLGGWIAPLALFPSEIRQLASWLPFRSTLGFPMEILTGQLSREEIWFGYCVTAAWLGVFLFIYRLLWKWGLKRYEAVGA